MSSLRVHLITTWDTACGIAEHSAQLKEAVEAADPSIIVCPDAVALDPQRFVHTDSTDRPAVVHLNYHDALHSRWTPDLLERLRQVGYPVVVTYHDTGVPNSDRCKAIVAAADQTIVHEPFDDLPAGKTRYWRQGVPGWPLSQFVKRIDPPHACQPLLGSIGFPFGWKCFDQLAEITGALGWALLLIAPSATAAQKETWKQLNPDLICRSDFVPRDRALALLAGCDATCFAYVCHNTGTSGAIRLGIAARKPVIALSTCRQFRDLYLDPLGRTAIKWVSDFEELRFTLTHLVPLERVSPPVVALAAQDSWAQLGARYARLYREVV